MEVQRKQKEQLNRRAKRVFFLSRFLKNRLSLLLFALFSFALLIIFAWIFYLPTYIIAYGGALILFGLCLLLALDFYRERKLLYWLGDYFSAAERFESEYFQNLSNTEYLLVNLMLSEWEQIASLRQSIQEAQREYEDYFALWLHRIKTPLAVLKLQLENAELKRPELIDAKLNELERYARLALVYVNLQDSERSMEIERFDLADLIISLKQRLEDYAESQKVEVLLDLDSLIIHADRLRLSHALEQFLVNAYKYGQGKKVEIMLKDQQLLIRDYGPGIPDYLLPRVQSRGFAAAEGELRYQSSGLGLYLAQRLLAEMALEYKLESRPAGGCDLRIDFKDISS